MTIEILCWLSSRLTQLFFALRLSRCTSYAGIPFHLPRPPRELSLHEQIARQNQRTRTRGTVVYRIKSNDKLAIDSIQARRKLSVAPKPLLKASSSSPSLAGFDDAASLPGVPRFRDLSNFQPLPQQTDGKGFEHNGISEEARKRMGFADVPSRYRAFRAAWDAKHEASHQEAAGVMLRQQAMAFELADASGDGQLDFREFKQLISSEMRGQNLDKKQIKAWFQALDVDNSGHISTSEFFVSAFSSTGIDREITISTVPSLRRWRSGSDGEPRCPPFSRASTTTAAARSATRR